MNPSAGWHDDPEQPGHLRYWDGDRWTEHRSPAAGPAAQPSMATATPRRGSTTVLWIGLGAAGFVILLLVAVLASVTRSDRTAQLTGQPDVVNR